MCGLGSGVIKFNGLNYADWYEQIQFQLGVFDLDLAIVMDEMPPAINETSTADEKTLYEAWQRSNRLSLNLMRMTMAENVKPSMPKTENAKEFIRMIKEYSQSDITDKSIVGTLMSELTTKKFDWSQPIHDHVTGMANIAAKLKSMGMEVNESFLVQFIMNSLPPEFGQFQVNYNTIKDKWNFQEIKAMLVQEEGRLKKLKDHSIHLMTHDGSTSSKANPGKKNKKDKAPMKVNEGRIKKDLKCFFCKKMGHFKKDCPKRKSWFEKKGTFYVSVNFETNIVEVPNNTWWLDSGATAHVSNIMQGFLSIQPIKGTEKYLYMGNRMKARIEGIGTYRLILDTGYCLDLEKCLYVPGCARNLISVAKLDCLGFNFKIENGVFHLYRHTYYYGSGTLCDGLYRLNLNFNFTNSLFNVEHVSSSQCNVQNENSAFLWHQRLGHISKERIMRLVKNEILPQLDFGDWDVCVDCIKGKQTKHISKNSATRSNELLELIHTDICGPFDIPSWSGEKYFITFIDDFSRYCYLYLLHEKSQSVDILKVFIDEVERQLDRKVKVVRSDRGGEFYGKSTESGQCPGPFAKFLESQGICAQYTMPGTPQQNGVVERRNRTLMDMVRSMLSHNNVPKSLWMYSLKTAVHLLNRVPSKAVPKTPFELWTGRKPSLRHLHVWGCPAEVRIYNPHEKKLDARTISGYFIGYPEKSKGYRFYCPNHSTRIVESGNARFIENGQFSGSDKSRIVDIQETNSNVSTHVSSQVVIPLVVSQSHNMQRQQVDVPIPQNEHIDNEPSDNVQVINEEMVEEPQEEILRRSVRQKRPAISDDYVVYSIEHECDLSIDEDPISVKQAMENDNSEKWFNAMKEELKSMDDNQVWDLVELPESYKQVGCKWVFKTKRDSKGNIERYKARLVAKGFTQKDGIDYKETFSPVSKKDSLRIILALVAHYDLELHQMDVKTAFLNGDLEEEIYMDQPEGFVSTGKENMVCKLKKSIYGLKQASRQWYIKFNDTITSYGFVENTIDRCIYMKVNGSMFVILVLYVDDILLATNNVAMLHDEKKFLSNNFEMKDMGEASYVIGIEIFCDRSQGFLGLSQKSYINKVLDRFIMDKCFAGIIPIQKGDKFSQMQYPKNDLE